MSRPTHIYVTAPEGRLTPIAKEDGVEPGGGQMYVRPGEVSTVRYWNDDGTTHQMIRRSRNRGDLILCTMEGAEVDSYEAAAVPIEGPQVRRDATPASTPRARRPFGGGS